MNPQQEGYLNGPYGTLHRSSSASRPGYATTTGGFPGTGLGINPGGGGRGQQRLGIDSLSQQVADMNIYGGGGEDRFAFNNGVGSRYDRTPSATMANSYMFGNNQAWSYNGNAATINDPSRLRTVNRRAPLPSEWGGMGDSGLGDGRLGGQLSGLQRGQLHQHYSPSALGGMATTNGQMYTITQPGGNGFGGVAPDLRPQPDEDDGPGLIKTAIVIKNIPFNVRKEALQNLMVDMNLPQPYAFNYHFDQGVFRGLAFANFAHPEETKMVIQMMNGLEVSGRKLRVEYKKMLPEHERERIEREKREKRGQLEEQHRNLAPLQHQPSSASLRTVSVSEAAANTFRKHGIDLVNNPSTLKFYMELWRFSNEGFSNEATREILIFPTEVTPEERRQIHIISHELGLHHTSIGDGDNRQVVVRKNPVVGAGGSSLMGDGVSEGSNGGLPPPTGATLDTHPRGLSRAATIDFAEQSRVGGPSGAFHAQARAGGLLGVPGSPDGPHAMNGLRGVKSFADLRSYSPSPSPSVTSTTNVGANVFLSHYTTDNAGFGSLPLGGPPQGGSGNADGSGPGATPPIMSGGLNSLTRAAFDAGGPMSRSRDVPGAIGSQRSGANGLVGRAPDRQPRGPGAEASGFGPRSRQNGHMQRGSDSSDTTRTGTSGSTWNH